MNGKIGCQTYGLGSFFEKDLEGIILKLHEAGVEIVEPYITFHEKQGGSSLKFWAYDTLDKAIQIMKPLSMKIYSAHIDAGVWWFTKNPNKVIEGIKAIHERYGISVFVVSGMFNSVGLAHRWARHINKISEGIKPYGCHILYHNHDDEFRKVYYKGQYQTILDVFLSECNEDIRLELDVGWAGINENELKIIRRYEKRIELIHFKDFYSEFKYGKYSRLHMPKKAFSPIGDGAVKVKDVIEVSKRLPEFKDIFIIDQDMSTRNIVDDVIKGANNLKKFLVNDAKEKKIECNRSRFSLMTMSLQKELNNKAFSIEDVLNLVKEEGLGGIDVISSGKVKVDEYNSAISKTGIPLYCYIAFISFFQNENAIKKSLKKHLERASSLHSSLFMIVPFFYFIDNTKTKTHGIDWTRKKLIRGFEIAINETKPYGLKVCFETTPQEDIHLSGTDDCLYVLERVKGLGFVFDTANMLCHGDDPLESYEKLKKYIIHVHLKDVKLFKKLKTFIPDERSEDGRKMILTCLGDGMIPVKVLYQKMLDDGYKGKFAIEYSREGKHPSLKDHKRRLEDHLDELEK